MKDLTITITGWVATNPHGVITRDGDGPRMCTFRLAQTSRYYDRNASKWTDRQTEWFTVRVFRDAAITVAESVSKGQPVVVQGRLRTNEWTDAEGKPRVDLQVDASVVGHDLTLGTATFTRVTVTDGPGVSNGDAQQANGDPAQSSSDDADVRTDAAGGEDEADEEAAAEEAEEPAAALA